MRQLVGLSCVHCGKSIGSIFDGRFCELCRCPIHVTCARPVADGNEAAGCAACGAKPADVQREQAVHHDGELQHQTDAGGVAASTSGWTVLLAPSERFDNPFATQKRHDMGSLDWQRGTIRVTGRKQVHEFRHVLDLALVRHPIPWFATILVNILILALVFSGFFTVLTPDNPFTWALLVCTNALLVWSAITNKWVRVTYRDKSGSRASVYLLPVSPGGWRRFNHASQQLLALLREEVLRGPSPGKTRNSRKQTKHRS